jgi:hypothetical protein
MPNKADRRDRSPSFFTPNGSINGRDNLQLHALQRGREIGDEIFGIFDANGVTD